MEVFLTYLWKSAIIIAIFYCFFRLFLIKETYFRSIRYFLLSGIVLAVVLPILTIPIYVDIKPISSTKTINNIIIQSTNSVSESSLNYKSLIYYSYLLVTGLFLIRLVSQLVSIARLIHTNNKIKVGNYYFVETMTKISPFSFFNFIIYNPDQFTQDELDQILAHEKVHVSHNHSLDTLLSNLLIALQWFNPIAWYFKNDIEQNLEFIADDLAVKVSHSKQSYQKLLLKTSIPQFEMALANNFYNSLLKKRIIMLHTKKSNSKSQWKIAFIVPFLLIFVFTFNTKAIAQQKKSVKKVEKVELEVVALSINKESSQKDLKSTTNTFKKEGLEIKFNNIKRNANNEITAIKIDAKAKSGKASASYASNDEKGIKPIIISFDNANNNLSIGSTEAMHSGEYHFSDNGLHKIIRHKVRSKDGNTFVFSDNDDHGDNKNITKRIWVNKKGDTTRIEENEIIEKIDEDNDDDHEDIHEIIIDDNGKLIEKKIIRIRSKKENGDNNFMFFSDDDDDDDQSNTIYIVNGKKMTKAEFKKFDKDKIKTLDIKKEVKKDK